MVLSGPELSLDFCKVQLLKWNKFMGHLPINKKQLISHSTRKHFSEKDGEPQCLTFACSKSVLEQCLYIQWHFSKKP